MPLTVAQMYTYSQVVSLHIGGEIDRKELMTEKAAIAQQPVISIRISEALRLKLEGLKVLMSMKSGEPVSTSEAAKQLLET